MKKLSVLIAIGLFAAACSAQAQLFGISIGHRGVSVGIGGPVCSGPPVVAYAPAPVYSVAPQGYCAPPQVVYAPQPACAAAPVYAPGYYGYSYGPSVVIGGGYGGWHHRYYRDNRGYWDHRGWRR